MDSCAHVQSRSTMPKNSHECDENACGVLIKEPPGRISNYNCSALFVEGCTRASIRYRLWEWESGRPDFAIIESQITRTAECAVGGVGGVAWVLFPKFERDPIIIHDVITSRPRQVVIRDATRQPPVPGSRVLSLFLYLSLSVVPSWLQNRLGTLLPMKLEAHQMVTIVSHYTVIYYCYFDWNFLCMLFLSF